MSDRITKAEIEDKFDSFLTATHRRKAKSHGDVGGYFLDHNSYYGGYVINQITSKGGAITQPFGSRRRSGRELIDAMAFALNSRRK